MPLIFAAIWIALEITMFIMVGDAIGIGATLILVALGVVCGYMIIRHHGMVFLHNARRARQEGSPISLNVADTGMAVIGGIFLIIPGFVSDTVGLVLLLKPLRNMLMPHGERIFKVKVDRNKNTSASSPDAQDKVIDLDESEWSHKDDTSSKE
jgi:UPF0716 protein FxsA